MSHCQLTVCGEAEDVAVLSVRPELILAVKAVAFGRREPRALGLKSRPLSADECVAHAITGAGIGTPGRLDHLNPCESTGLRRMIAQRIAMAVMSRGVAFEFLRLNR